MSQFKDLDSQAHKKSFFTTSSSSVLSKPKILDVSLWKNLKELVYGPNGFLTAGWIAQGFEFSHQIPYGFLQKKGGPCGVLAVVQALLLRNLLFNSEFITKNIEISRFEDVVEEEYFMLNNPEDLFRLSPNDLIRKLKPALIAALAEILFKCAPAKDNTAPESNFKIFIVLSSPYSTSIGPGSEIYEFSNISDVLRFLAKNISRFECINLVYSAALTHGIEKTKNDMDFENCSLLGQYGYCTQELINLLTVGEAISNSFDNEIELNGKVLKGIKNQADIGLLSLYEHYNSCMVGSFLKNPKYPLWIVCSESHYSLLFSTSMKLTTLPSSELNSLDMHGGKLSEFELLYYDGLALQDEIILLTITTPKNLAFNGDLQAQNDEFDLVPPLEKCIRTKWTGAQVCWNGSEPIL